MIRAIDTIELGGQMDGWSVRTGSEDAKIEMIIKEWPGRIKKIMWEFKFGEEEDAPFVSGK